MECWNFTLEANNKRIEQKSKMHSVKFSNSLRDVLFLIIKDYKNTNLFQKLISLSNDNKELSLDKNS
jgi:hypothetical protein